MILPGKFRFIIILSLLHLSFIGLSQNPTLEIIDTLDLKRHLSFLASDSLQGRSFNTPTPGLDIAAEYLKTNIKKMGLKDGASDFFQTVPVLSVHPDNENSFCKILDKNEKEIFQTDSIVGFISVEGIDIERAEIVFAGFGYRDEKTGYNDFEDIDVKGKLVLFSTGTPERFKNNEKPRWDNRLESAKIEYALKLGASGVILANNPLDKGNSIYNRIFRWKNRGFYSLNSSDKTENTYNFLFTTSFQADRILGEPGKLNALLKRITKKKQPDSFKIKGRKATVKIKNKTEKILTNNVIGIVEGSDNELKNECVVLMAHYDHLGIDESGNIYNGADDNGSGTVTLLEVAEAFNSLEKKPKRSVVFLWVTAEEVGMLGSGYYADNPTFPMQKTVTCINIDMDGRVFESRDSVWKDSPKMVKDFDGLFTLTNEFLPELKEINNAACKTLGIIPDYSLPSRFLRSSDHYSFHDKGVPIINYATGYHADYHKVSDEISRINFDKIKRVADLCFLVAFDIANQEKIEIITP
jgi:hypothetical protein